jgi:hypothetical protein
MELVIYLLIGFAITVIADCLFGDGLFTVLFLCGVMALSVGYLIDKEDHKVEPKNNITKTNVVNVITVTNYVDFVQIPTFPFDKTNMPNEVEKN